jgi:CrcB protein
MWLSFLSVSVGAGVGAVCRWGLQSWLNGRGALPIGTLVANLVGGYLVGLAMAHVNANDTLSPQWKFAVVTGFLGWLTTFSAFSWEAAALMRSGQTMMAMGAIGAHVLGSLAMTFLGIGTYQLIKS